VKTQITEKCPNADRYSGLRFPRCNGGKPCKACLLKYATVQTGHEVHTAHAAFPKCACGYDERIAGAFDNVAARINRDKKQPSTAHYLKALGHTTVFPGMVAAVARDANCIYQVLADAVRYGVVMGRTMEELERLEEMVGYKDGQR
jgi:hypothetical protein